MILVLEILGETECKADNGFARQKQSRKAQASSNTRPIVKYVFRKGFEDEPALCIRWQDVITKESNSNYSVITLNMLFGQCTTN